MYVGFVGLGKMGANMARRLVENGHDVVGYDRNPDAGAVLLESGGKLQHSLADLVQALPAPRCIWMMVPAGSAVNSTIETLRPLLSQGDTLIDGGNSHYQDSVKRAGLLAVDGVDFLDVGVSGGVWGLLEGYCLMVGGNETAYRKIQPLLSSLAVAGGALHAGESGAGHYAKMIHNGIEYGLMQSYAEGFELLQASPYDFEMKQLCELWNNGSVIRSWLLELAEKVFAEDPKLESLEGYVQDSGEGRWTVAEAINRAVPVPVISAALFARFRSRTENTFGERFLAALRNKFGGHEVKSQVSNQE